jgi:hypothetical protein
VDCCWGVGEDGGHAEESSIRSDNADGPDGARLRAPSTSATTSAAAPTPSSTTATWLGTELDITIATATAPPAENRTGHERTARGGGAEGRGGEPHES